MADWSQVNVWDTSGDVITRVRRLERGSQYLRAGQIVTPSGSYAGVPVTLLSNGKIDLTSPDLASQGSIPALGVIGTSDSRLRPPASRSIGTIQTPVRG